MIALGNFIQVYMEDLRIDSKTADKHLDHLEFVL
jgi:hypothetical protein